MFKLLLIRSFVALYNDFSFVAPELKPFSHFGEFDGDSIANQFA